MPSYFCLSIRFLNPAFHGRGEGNRPEWPPSPMRAFQALVAAAARKREARCFDALRWLEQQSAPLLIAAAAVVAETSYRISVPNNTRDLAAGAWARGNESDSGDANPATHRIMKSIRPMLLSSGDAVHYLWPLIEPMGEETPAHLPALEEVARSVAALGWGIDAAIGCGRVLSEEQAEALPGERWFPAAGATGNMLRLPKPGTLKALEERHAMFLNRIGRDGFMPPPLLIAYRTAGYRRAWDPVCRPVAAFALRKPDGSSGFRSFDTAPQALTLSGLLRHATKLAAQRSGWPEEAINSCVLGHGEARGEAHVSVGARRFAYLPLPGIEAGGAAKARAVGRIRRVLITTLMDGYEREIAWSRRALDGQDLIAEDTAQPVAVLDRIPEAESLVQMYTRPSSLWATVTPVVLPGYDDPAHYRRRLQEGIDAREQKKLLGKLYGRTDALLRKAITQGGLSQQLADHAKLEWRKVGFWAGAELADHYGVPQHLKRFSRLHVRIQWRDAQNNPIRVPGPICVGGGRFFGLGLFASAE